MENVLEVKNIEKYYGNKSNLTKAIDNISFNVKNGEFVGIMGASGSGKTTLLNCVSTIDRVTAGHIIINGEDITKLKGNKLNKFRREELGFIFQDFNLLDTLTIYENIALALTIQKVNATEINNRVYEIAKKLDILGIMNKYPYQVWLPVYYIFYSHSCQHRSYAMQKGKIIYKRCKIILSDDEFRHKNETYRFDIYTSIICASA